MKIRYDFVSNSSSSSFIFSADFNKYDFNDFIKSVCKNCHDDSLSENDIINIQNTQNNTAVLMYCLKYFELLHLGTIVNGRKKDIVRRGYDQCGNKIDDKDELAFSEFEFLKSEYIDNQKKFNCLDTEETSVKMIDENTLEYEYNDFMPDGIVVTHEYMENIIRNKWSCSQHSSTEARKNRVAEILKVLQNAKNIKDDLWCTPYSSDTYLITKNTIANTRDLIACGYNIQFDKWENINALDARLSAGETIFHIVCGDLGEGGGDTRLLGYDTQNPFHGLPLEYIDGF